MILDKVKCFLGLHDWADPNIAGLVYCDKCKAISLKRSDIKPHYFKPCEIVDLNNKPIYTRIIYGKPIQAKSQAELYEKITGRKSAVFKDE